MNRTLVVIVAATCSLIIGGELVIFQRISQQATTLADAKTQAKVDRDLTAATMKAQNVATANLASRIDDQTSKIEKLSETVTLSIPREIGHNHTEVRKFIIKSQIAQADDPIVIVGDSITEAALFPSSICGQKLINAGIGGLDTKTYAAIINDVLPAKSVPLIVVALGTNNSTRAASRHTFAKSYNSLADILATHAVKLMFIGVPRVEMTGALASGYFDSDSIDRHDAKIRDIAKQRSVDFIDVRSGAETSGMTVDGVHLNADGYMPWRSAVLSSIEAALGCKAAQN